MAKDDDYKESEWNSNEETLKRIHRLIVQMHDHAFNREYTEQLKILYRIISEAQTKMSDTEKKRFDDYDQSIEKLQSWYKDYIDKPTIRKQGTTTYIPNTKHQEYIARLKPIVVGIEIELMECLDKHNMLLSNKGDARKSI